jgi:hypothetical protein
MVEAMTQAWEVEVNGGIHMITSHGPSEEIKPAIKKVSDTFVSGPRISSVCMMAWLTIKLAIHMSMSECASN